MKTKCMSCSGPTKKMQAGGLLKAQLGGNVLKKVKVTRPMPKPRPEPSKTGGGRGPIKPIKKVLKKRNPNLETKPGCFGASCGKMQEGETLPKAQNGGTRRNARTGKHTGGPLSCFERARRTNKNRKFWHSGGGKTIKNIGKTVLGAAAVVGAGAVAYKKSTPFKNAVDNIKGKLGFNQKGGAVKKYQNGGTADSLKVIKKEGKLAVKTEKQKQAAAKKAAANAKKIAKAKENARLNLEWQKMTKDQKDSLWISERQKNW